MKEVFSYTLFESDGRVYIGYYDAATREEAVEEIQSYCGVDYHKSSNEEIANEKDQDCFVVFAQSPSEYSFSTLRDFNDDYDVIGVIKGTSDEEIVEEFVQNLQFVEKDDFIFACEVPDSSSFREMFLGIESESPRQI